MGQHVGQINGSDMNKVVPGIQGLVSPSADNTLAFLVPQSAQ